MCQKTNSEIQEVIDAAAAIRSLIQHEDKLRDGRVQWLLLTQSILVAAYAQLFDKAGIVSSLISVFGIATTISFLAAFKEGTAATRTIKKEWKEFLEKKASPSGIILRIMGYQHDIDGNNNDNKMLPHGMVPHHFLPYACSLFWAALLVASIFSSKFLP